jgi:hypothetical protein
VKTEVVSFYCDIDGRTYYSDHSRRLRINCNENNIPHDIRELPSRGEYRLNCLAKPKFLLSVLEEKKKPFIWLDVDSLIHNELKVFDEIEDKCDMGFAYQGFPPRVNANHPKASPIYLTYKSIVIDFLNYWIERCEFNELNLGTKVFDHEILMMEVLPLYLPQMKIAQLPINYAIWPGTKIPDNMQPMITMGIADGTSKEKSLREMGLDEATVQFNLVGNKNENSSI